MRNPDHFTEAQRIILGAIAILPSPARWCQGSSARVGTLCHDSTDYWSPNATRWCMMGALHLAAYRILGRHATGDTKAFNVAVTAVERAIGPGVGVPSWNDSPFRTHQHVLAKLLQAVPIAANESIVDTDEYQAAAALRVTCCYPPMPTHILAGLIDSVLSPPATTWTIPDFAPA